MIGIKDIGWIAGFLEGEGYPWSHTNYSSPYISASQVQKEPLEKLKSLLGGEIHLFREKQGNSQKCYRWVAGGSRAAGIMLTLYSLMSTKRKMQILKVIEKWKKGPGINWKGKLTYCQNGHEFTEENIYRHPTHGTRECRICKKKREKKRWLESQVSR